MSLALAGAMQIHIISPAGQPVEVSPVTAALA
jgi:hypothetical protein